MINDIVSDGFSLENQLRLQHFSKMEWRWDKYFGVMSVCGCLCERRRQTDTKEKVETVAMRVFERCDCFLN